MNNINIDNFIYNFPNKKYSIIYADPPWGYHVWKKDIGKRTANSYYSTLYLKDISSFPINNISNENCILFLWTTGPCIWAGVEVCKNWGFNYKTIGFVWIKTNKKSNSLFWGMGNWTRANAEYCLIAIKGKVNRIAKNVHQVIMSPIENHSKKPDIIRNKIIDLVGDLPRIELFSRKRVDGWDCWGDEI